MLCVDLENTLTILSMELEVFLTYKIHEYHGPIILRSQKEKERCYSISFDMSLNLPVINSLTIKFKGTKSINQKLSFEYNLKGSQE